MLRQFIVICLATYLATPFLVADSVQLPVTQDNSIVLVDGEWTENTGTQGRIRIKGNQHIVALGFDTTLIAGKRVKRAALICQQSDQQISGVTISTIAVPWDESLSNGLTAGIVGIDGWGSPGARFPAVCGGNGFTWVHSVPSLVKDGVYTWEVPPDMVHALASGVAHGLAVHEYDADYGRNPTIFAREQAGQKPYLLVEWDDQPEPTPAFPTELKLVPVDRTSALLTLKAPAAGFAYEVTVDNIPLGRHNIPWVVPGETQRIALRDLPASVTTPGVHQIQVTTLNRTGQRSQRTEITSALFQADPIEAPQFSWPEASRKPIPNLAVLPVTDKYDQSGQPVGNLPADYRTHNSIFDGQRVRLTAAAGEVAGFQTLLRGTGEVSVQVQLDGPPWRIDLHQAVYVPAEGRMIPDPLLPLPQHISLKADQDQSVLADLYVPFDAPPGVRHGQIVISDGRTVPLQLTILPYALPKRATFFCEMNGYGLPEHVDDYYALQQIAYDHRVHANILHYSHHTAAPGARKTNLDMRLRSGRRMDNKRYDNIAPGAKVGFWEDFAEAFGPYLDGSLFQGGHRGPIPAPGFYLTFHESWPLNCRAYFNGNPDAFSAFSAQPVYAETYVNVLHDFAKLAQSKGWNETGFHVYFNNKGSLKEETKAPWILDEPSSYWDYRALRYYGELTDQGRAGVPKVTIDYRIDISRPEFDRGQLGQRGDLWVVSSWAFQHYRRLVTDRLERDGLKAWVYGSSNHVHETNRNLQAWALDAWRYGATGIVPWQTVDKDGTSLKEANQLGLFIFDKDASGQTVIRHSMRLKAYREAQQLIESLNLLQQHRHWSASQMREFLDQYTPLDAQVHKVNDADAGTTAYDRLTPLGVESLKRAVGELLSKPPRGG